MTWLTRMRCWFGFHETRSRHIYAPRTIKCRYCDHWVANRPERSGK